MQKRHPRRDPRVRLIELTYVAEFTGEIANPKVEAKGRKTVFSTVRKYAR
jgi:hypothetical protein